MTEEQKKIVIKEFCSKLPYGLKVDFYSSATREHYMCTLIGIDPEDEMPVIAVTNQGSFRFTMDHIKPYLRSMDSMTKDEMEEYETFLCQASVRRNCTHYDCVEEDRVSDLSDWLDEHMFDRRGLIDMGFAIEDTDGVYNESMKK